MRGLWGGIHARGGGSLRLGSAAEGAATACIQYPPWPLTGQQQCRHTPAAARRGGRIHPARAAAAPRAGWSCARPRWHAAPPAAGQNASTRPERGGRAKTRGQAAATAGWRAGATAPPAPPHPQRRGQGAQPAPKQCSFAGWPCRLGQHNVSEELAGNTLEEAGRASAQRIVVHSWGSRGMGIKRIGPC